MSEAFIDLKCNKSCRHIRELEQQKAELIEFAKDSIYMTTPELWNKRNELLKKHGVEI